MSDAMHDLVEVVAQLRDPNHGCPWDLKQTHQTLVPYVLEEAHEVVDAIRHGDDRHLKEELGDLLLQVVLHAQLAQEQQRFDLEAIARGITEKLIRRHPHVFGTAEAHDSETVSANWDAIKAAEQAERGESPSNSTSPLSAQLTRKVRGQPALAGAMTISRKAAKAGFEWMTCKGFGTKCMRSLMNSKKRCPPVIQSTPKKSSATCCSRL